MDSLKAKSEAVASTNKFLLIVGTPKKIGTDNANKRLSKQFNRQCLDAGNSHVKTIPETPKRNRLAERCKRTLPGKARCLLIDSRLPMLMRGAAVLHAAKIRNLFVRRGEKRSPAELMRGIKPQPSISKLSIFGCRVFIKKREKEVGKLEPKALEGILRLTLTMTPDTSCSFPRFGFMQGSGCYHQGVRRRFNP